MWKILLFLLLLGLIILLLLRPRRNRPPRGRDDGGNAPLMPMLSADGSGRRGESPDSAPGKAEAVFADGADGGDDGGD